MSFAVGTGALAVSKILENMEVGHNVMHGQYDWTGDPELDSRSYEWDIVCTGDDWRHYHNYEHHTFTKIVGKDRDVGYALLRVAAEQPWNSVYLPQPLSALLLAFVFQWGVGGFNLRIPETLAGEQSLAELRARSRPFLAKAARQLAKDYALFPALAGWNAPRVLLGNLLANPICRPCATRSWLPACARSASATVSLTTPAASSGSSPAWSGGCFATPC